MSSAWALTPAECAPNAPKGKVTFCHATSSPTNPYVMLTVSTNACLNGHVGHAGDALADCAGVCGGTAVVDCAGTCGGTAVADCAGSCDGTAVADCAGVCNGTAEPDCAGVCNGGAAVSPLVYFTTNTGVYSWSPNSPAAPPAQISSFPSYSLVVSPAGQIYVGTGGIEAQASGVAGLAMAGIYSVDGVGAATLVSAIAAEDLQFSPAGVLHVANSTGIYAISGAGAATQRSINPTSQFAFESETDVVTTNGIVYQAVFARGTDRIDLVTDTATLVNGDGGEDIHVIASGEVLVCGQGGLFSILPSGAFSAIYKGLRIFNFDLTSAADLYVGNTASYGGMGWPVGLFELLSGATAHTQIDSADINALVVDERCR